MIEQNNKFSKLQAKRLIKKALFNEIFSFSKDYAKLEKKLLGKSIFAPWDSLAIKRAYFTPSKKIFKKINPLPCCFSAVLAAELNFKTIERDKFLAIIANSSQNCYAIKSYCQKEEKEQLDYKGLFLMMSSLTSYAIANNLLLAMSKNLKCEYKLLKSFSNEINNFFISLGYHFSDLKNFRQIEKKDYFTYILNSSLAVNMRLAADLACLYKGDSRCGDISKLIEALILSKDLSSEMMLLKKSKILKKSWRKRFCMSVFKKNKSGAFLISKEKKAIALKEMNILLKQNDKKLEILLSKKNLSFLKGFAVYFKNYEFDVYE
jgi:hypothetical protein